MAQSRPGDPGRRGDPVGRFGSTVAGRYRLDEPRHGDLPGAERWTATDQILARRVTVTLVTGPRAAAVLDAARRAALVVDPRLARILDVGTADGTGYVVTEAVEGRSLAALAARAPLSPDQARAVLGEAAAALEVARRRGVHHLALRPEAVVLTAASRVVVEGLAVDGELLGATGGGAHAMSRTDTVGLVRVLYAALTGRWPAAPTGTAAVPTFDEWAAGPGDAPAADADPGLPAAPEQDGSPAAPADLVPGVPADLDTLCVVTLGPHDDGPHSPGELVRELEPWRAVRADEVFRAADAGRWPALTDSPVPPRPDGGTPTGTTTAPPTGSSPMSDDQQRTSPTADGDTPAAGSPATTGTGRSAGPGRTAGRGAGAGGAAAAGAGAAGAGAGAAGAGAGAATGAGAADATGAATSTAAGAAAGGGSAAGAAAAAGAGVGAGAGVAAGAAVGGVARQSVRSAFGATPSPGARRPGTPPPAVPVGSRTSAPTGDVPSEEPGLTPPTVPPARSGSAAEPAPASTPEMPPAIPPAGRGASSDGAGTGATPTRPTGAAPSANEGRPSAGDGSADAEQDRGRDGRPAAAEAAVAGLTAAAAASTRSASAPGSGEPARAETADETGDAGPGPDAAEPGTGEQDPAERAAVEQATTQRVTTGSGSASAPVRRTTSVFATVTPDPRPAPSDTAEDSGASGATAEADEPDVDTPLLAASGGGGATPGHPDWDLPFPADEPARGPGQRRFDPTRWVLGLVAIGVIVGVVIAIGNVLRPWDGGGDDSAAPVPVVTPTATTPPADAGSGDADASGGDDQEAPPADPPVIAGVTTIDPSDDDGEHEELVGRLTDGDPATSWYTHTYNRPDFAGFKDAVGLVITLQQPAVVTAITLDVNGSGGNVEVRSTDGANPTAGDVLAAGPLSPQTVLTLSQPTETQSIVLWFTALAQAPDGANKIEISTLSVS